MNCIAQIVIVSLPGGLWSSTPVCLESRKSRSVCYGNLELGKRKTQKCFLYLCTGGKIHKMLEWRGQGERINLPRAHTEPCERVFIYAFLFNYFCFQRYSSLNRKWVCTGFCDLKGYQCTFWRAQIIMSLIKKEQGKPIVQNKSPDKW